MEKQTVPLTFRVVQPDEIEAIKEEVRLVFFSGDAATIEDHFQEHDNESSTTLLGYEAGRLIGIVTIRWNCRYPPFREQGIPLIQNIEIRFEDRGRGLGALMLERTEQEIAKRSAQAGICVGISDGYGPAQRLYVKRGFVPDGRSVCHPHEPLADGEVVTIGDDLLLWLVKDVSASRHVCSSPDRRPCTDCLL